MNCTVCNEDGLIHVFKKTTGKIKVYACHCDRGKKQREPVYAKNDKEKMWPTYPLPVWRPKEDVREKQFKEDD